MLVGLIAAGSVLTQFVTVCLALKLIKVTGSRISWILISSAIFFMAIRRCIMLSRVVSGDPFFEPALSFELAGLLTSVLMLAGVILISPLFKSMADNIFALKQAEESLRENEAKYRSLVESSDDSIYLVDRNCRYLFMNEKHRLRLGLSKNHAGGEMYSDFHSPEKTDEFAERVDRVFRTGGSLQYEHRSYRDGSYFLRTLSPVKGTGGEVLAVTVVSKQITELKMTEEKIRRMSLTDELTGLYNRRGFFTLSQYQFEAARRIRQKATLFFADLDGLKSVNDILGHEKGDMALIDAATILKNTFRSTDTVARVGGDEFAVLTAEVPEPDADLLVERLQKNIEALNKGGSRPYRLSMSVGVAFYDPVFPESMDELLCQADNRMYEQKRAKKNGPAEP